MDINNGINQMIDFNEIHTLPLEKDYEPLN